MDCIIKFYNWECSLSLSLSPSPLSVVLAANYNIVKHCKLKTKYPFEKKKLDKLVNSELVESVPEHCRTGVVEREDHCFDMDQVLKCGADFRFGASSIHGINLTSMFANNFAFLVRTVSVGVVESACKIASSSLFIKVLIVEIFGGIVMATQVSFTRVMRARIRSRAMWRWKCEKEK